jgi:hypothetical protein
MGVAPHENAVILLRLGGNGAVHTCRLQPPGIVDQSQVWMGVHHRADDSMRLIAASSIGDDQGHASFPAVGSSDKQAFKTGADEMLFVQRWHHDQNPVGPQAAVRGMPWEIAGAICHAAVTSPQAADSAKNKSSLGIISAGLAVRRR